MSNIFNHETAEPALQTMAINKIIQHSFREEIIKNRNKKTLRRLCSNMKRYVRVDLHQKSFQLCQNKPKIFIDPVNSSRSNISTSSKIQITMQKYTDSLINSVKDWLDYHMSACFHRTTKHMNRIYFLRRFHQFSYHPDGTINYVKTARNILTNDKFSQIDKYAIACLYCFEEEIRSIWPEISENVHVDEISSDLFPLQHYWTCRMTNQLNKIHSTRNSKELSVIMQRFVYRVWEIEFFWNRLSSANKEFAMRYFFSENIQYKMEFFVKCLCSEPNEELIRRIVKNHGPSIMLELVTNSHNCKFALPVWSRIGNMFEGEQFIQIYANVFQRRDNNPDPNHQLEIEQKLCIEVWNSAPEELKKYASKSFISSTSMALHRLKNLVNQ
ncbi:uncharacterized protein LOC135846513 [Planococcus citri]|uniref:uncharacterized protein LOC135846513 n=1 Tax=Planococcus citri TaxID=170843 RepID=UPI0031F89125